MKTRLPHANRLVFGVAAFALALSVPGISSAGAVNPVINIPVSSDGFGAQPVLPEPTAPGDDSDRENDDEIVDVPDPILAEAILARTGKNELTRATLRKLVGLNIDGLDVTDLTGLEHATRLSKLEMRGTLVTTLDPLEGAEAMMYLYAGYLNLSDGTVRQSQLDDISVLKHLPLLDYVSLNGANISSIEPLRGAEKLVRVEVASVSALKDLSPLEESPKLREVYAQQTSVDDLSPLGALREMRTISVPNANVSDISTVAGLPELTILNVNGNHVTDISMLDSWPKLSQVGFQAQTISLPRVYASATEPTYVNLDTALPFRMPDGETVAATAGATALAAGGTRWENLDGTETELSAVFANSPGEDRPLYSATATRPVTFADFDAAPKQGEKVSATVGRSVAFDFSTIAEFSGGEYTLAPGAIPGMALDQAGQLTGTPSAAGQFALVVSLTDKHGNTITRSFSMNVSSNTSGGSEEPPVNEAEDPQLTIDGDGQTVPTGDQAQLASTGAHSAQGLWLAGFGLVLAGLLVAPVLRRRSNA